MKRIVCVFLMASAAVLAQFPVPGGGTGGGGGVGAANATATSVAAVTSLAINVASLNLSTTDSFLIQCWSGTAAPFSPVTITSLNPVSTSSITANFTSTANVTCRVNSNGGAGPTGPAGGGGGEAAGFAATISSSTELAVTAGIARIGKVVSNVGTATPTLSGSTASSTAYAYIDSAGVATIGHAGAATITAAPYTVLGGITGFPDECQPLFEATYVNNVWTAVTNKLAHTSRSIINAGSGLSKIPNASGDETFAVVAKVQNDAYFAPAGSTDGGTGVYGPIICWSSPNGCATDLLTAGNRRNPTVGFSNSGTTLSSTIYWRIPNTWDGGAISLVLTWSRGSGAGTNVVWSVQTVCQANAEDLLGTTYNTAQTVTTTAPAVGFRAESTISSLTLTGCAANETLVVMPSRASGDAADDLAATVHLVSAVLRYKQSLTN